VPTYRYKARDKFGALFTGTIDTSGKDAVAAQLDTQGYIPVKIEEQSEKKTDFLERFQRVTSEDLIIFSRQLATLISAGLPFTTSLDALVEQTENRRLKRIIAQIRRDLEGGSSFSDALARHPAVFNDLFVNMVRAGEAGGVLDEMLDRLATLAEHDAETRARIKAATRYPKIVVAAIVAAFIILVTFVIPKFSELYAGFKTELPLPTRILVGMNNFVHHYWYIALLLVVSIVIGVRQYVRTPRGHVQWDGLKLKLPVFGPIFLKTALSRFSRIFGTLTRSGLPVLQTLEIVSKTVGNVVIARVVDNLRDSVRQGRGLVQPMRLSRIFPPTVIQMVAIGEETGKMEEMLMRVSNYYDRDVEYSIKNLSTTLEPLLLAVIGGMVLFLALAIFLPWWNLIRVFKGGG
jgi:type II secretory pathway component PulF